MRSRVNKSCIFCVLMVFFCPAATVGGRVIYVDDNGPADFNNIQVAINDANDGNTTILADGKYYMGEGVGFFRLSP